MSLVEKLQCNQAVPKVEYPSELLMAVQDSLTLPKHAPLPGQNNGPGGTLIFSSPIWCNLSGWTLEKLAVVSQVLIDVCYVLHKMYFVYLYYIYFFFSDDNNDNNIFIIILSPMTFHNQSKSIAIFQFNALGKDYIDNSSLYIRKGKNFSSVKRATEP